MRDHSIAGNASWARLLELVEQERRPMNLEKQRGIVSVDAVPLNLPWISTQLWAFIGNHLAPSIYQQHLSLDAGEEYNGLERWRRLYLDNEGGAEQVVLSGIRRFHSFEK